MLCQVVNPFDQNWSSLFRPAKTLLCAGLAFNLLPVIGSANAQSKYLNNSGDVRRVAGFYVIDAEADPSVCRPILLSLNKEYRISGDKLDENPRVSMPSDSLLGSDLQVPWARKLVQQPDANSYKTTSIDVAQIKSRGRTLSLFRRGLEKFSIEQGALSINRLWVSTSPAPVFPSGRALTADDVARIPGVEIFVNVSNEPRIDKRQNPAVSKGWRRSAEPMLLNVVSLEDKLYLLAIDAIQAEIAAPRSNNGTIDLFVLQLVSPSDIRATCHFRSN
jgi:hypothetical protein